MAFPSEASIPPRVGFTRERVSRFLAAKVDSEMTKKLGTIRDLMEEEFREKGREEGRVEVLLHQLEQLFGELPAEVVERVRAASAESIDGWVSRVLTATTLEDVFAHLGDRPPAVRDQN